MFLDMPVLNILYVYMHLPTPPHDQDVIQCHFFKLSLTGLNSELSFSLTGCHTKVKESSLP